MHKSHEREKSDDVSKSCREKRAKHGVDRVVRGRWRESGRRVKAKLVRSNQCAPRGPKSFNLLTTSRSR